MAFRTASGSRHRSRAHEGELHAARRRVVELVATHDVDLRAVFSTIDTDGDGLISRLEALEGLRSLGLGLEAGTVLALGELLEGDSDSKPSYYTSIATSIATSRRRGCWWGRGSK